MQRVAHSVEFATGLLVLAAVVGLFWLALKVSSLGTQLSGPSYGLSAEFDNIGGLKPGAPVKAAGVTVGQVESIRYDATSFRARVELKLATQYAIFPEDTVASILTSGLLGEQYIGLEPGGADALLGDGGRLRYTQSALVLEQMIGRFLLQKAEGQ